MTTTTLQNLQQRLSTPPLEFVKGFIHKANTPTIKCADGTTLSVQASQYHYCTPREDVGPYTAVEVWCIAMPVFKEITEFEYSEEEPSAYVPIGDVVRFIDNHGGMIN